MAGETQTSNGNASQYDAFNQMARYTSGSEDWVYIYGPDDERFWSVGRAMSYTDPTGMAAMGRIYAPTGMTTDDIAATFDGGTVNVTAPAWRGGTTSNPYTGLIGANTLLLASNFMSTITILADDHRQRMGETWRFIEWSYDWYNQQMDYQNCEIIQGQEVCMAIAMAPPPAWGRSKGPKGTWKPTSALRKHNGVVDRIVKELDLTYKQRRRLDDVITKEELDEDEIGALAKAMFDK